MVLVVCIVVQLCSVLSEKSLTLVPLDDFSYYGLPLCAAESECLLSGGDVSLLVVLQ